MFVAAMKAAYRMVCQIQQKNHNNYGEISSTRLRVTNLCQPYKDCLNSTKQASKMSTRYFAISERAR